MPLRTAQRAFTLFELLVVIAIIGIILSFASLSVNINTPTQLLQRDLQRLQALIHIAHEEAILQGRDYGIEVKLSGYRFYQLQDEQWLIINRDNDSFLRERQWKSDVDIELSVEGLPVSFDDETNTPHLMLLSSGEATSFTLILYSQLDRQVSYRLQGDLLCQTELEEVEK